MLIFDRAFRPYLASFLLLLACFLPFVKVAMFGDPSPWQKLALVCNPILSILLLCWVRHHERQQATKQNTEAPEFTLEVDDDVQR